MELLTKFIEGEYEDSIGSRVSLKSIYTDYIQFMIELGKKKEANSIQKNKFYKELKNNENYAFARYSEGWCLKGKRRKDTKAIKLNIITQEPKKMLKIESLHMQQPKIGKLASS